MIGMNMKIQMKLMKKMILLQEGKVYTRLLGERKLIWSQRIICWSYYDACRVHCLNLESADVYMLIERKYPLSAEQSRMEEEQQHLVEVLCTNTTNGYQSTMSNRHKDWLVQEQTALGKDFSNPFLCIRSLQSSNYPNEETDPKEKLASDVPKGVVTSHLIPRPRSFVLLTLEFRDQYLDVHFRRLGVIVKHIQGVLEAWFGLYKGLYKEVFHASGSGADEGTGVTPGVLDAPDYDSEDDISWKSSDDDQDNEKAQDAEDEDKYDVNETTQDDEDDDVHGADENAQDDD
ncbi:hypothetical protein Tco_1368883 [Tanacetum coccineum]